MWCFNDLLFLFGSVKVSRYTICIANFNFSFVLLLVCDMSFFLILLLFLDFAWVFAMSFGRNVFQRLVL